MHSLHRRVCRAPSGLSIAPDYGHEHKLSGHWTRPMLICLDSHHPRHQHPYRSCSHRISVRKGSPSCLQLTSLGNLLVDKQADLHIRNDGQLHHIDDPRHLWNLATCWRTDELKRPAPPSPTWRSNWLPLKSLLVPMNQTKRSIRPPSTKNNLFGSHSARLPPSTAHISSPVTRRHWFLVLSATLADSQSMQIKQKST